MYKSRKIIILNKSQGEIDWLIFNQSNLFNDNSLIYVYCNQIDKSTAIKYAPNFFSQEHVFIFNLSDIMTPMCATVILKLELFFARLSSFMINKLGSRLMQDITELALVYVRRLIASFLSPTLKECTEFNELLFENNFRSSLFFEVMKKKCKPNFTQITLFPHHFGPLEKENLLTRLIIKSMNITRCIVNNEIEERGVYKYLEPSKVGTRLSRNINVVKKHFLFLTRQCSTHYGFKYDDAFVCFERALIEVRNLYPDAEIKVKHHPRDSRLNSWNDVSNKYGGKELFTSAIDYCVKYNNTICIHFYTSLVEPLHGLGVKCFDISPYKAYDDINFAFFQVDGKISNSYLVQHKTRSVLAEDIAKYI
jgi:hypothetical protein